MFVSSNNPTYKVSSSSASSPTSTVGASNFQSSSITATGGQISISSSITSFQSSLMSNALDKAGSAALEETPINEDGSFNPVDMLTQSDIALFEKVTGYTIKDGMIVDENGNAPPVGPDGRSPELNLMLALSDIRIYGTTDANGQMQKISGDITAKDTMEYLNQFREDGPYDNPLLDKAEALLKHSALAAVSQTRVPGETLAETYARGVVNPVEWLSDSDIALFENTTGYTIKDGVIYDKDGNQNTDPAVASMANALFEIRNSGSFDASGDRYQITGDLSISDLKAFMEHYQSNIGAYDIGMLNKAFDVLTTIDA